MEGVVAHPEADQLGQNVRATPACVLVLLEHHGARAVAEHETVAVLVPGPAGGHRIVVAGRQRPRGGKSGDAQRRRGLLGAAGDHHVGDAQLDLLCGNADGMRAGGAGGGDRDVRTLEAKQDGEVAGDHVHDGAGHEERRHLAHALVVQRERRAFDIGQATDARAHGHADPRRIGLGDCQPGLAHRLDRGNQPVLDEDVVAPRFLRVQEALDVEALHLAGEGRGIRGGIPVGDRRDAAAAGQQPGPGVLDGVAQGRHHAHAGDHDTTPAHDSLLPQNRMPAIMARAGCTFAIGLK